LTAIHGGHRDLHALVIGGTGILRPLASSLVERGWQVTVVAREASDEGFGRYVVSVDASRSGMLAGALDAAIAGRGPFELCVVYAPFAHAGSMRKVAARSPGRLLYALTSRHRREHEAAQFTLGGFVRVFDLPFLRWFFNSVVIAVAAVALTVSINLVCGYAFAKLRFPGRRILFLLIVSTLIIPIQVLMVPQFQIVARLGWIDTYWGVIIPRAAEAFGIFFCVQFFRGIPDELIEAARLDGASELTILRRIVLPLSKPLIAVLVIFTFMWRWNEFAWPLIVLKDSTAYTLPIGLRFLEGQFTKDYPALMAGSLISILPMLVIFVLFQRYFIEGVTRSGLK
jgi:alpha-1,4-digalacturonate transport system permease protein